MGDFDEKKEVRQRKEGRQRKGVRQRQEVRQRKAVRAGKKKLRCSLGSVPTAKITPSRIHDLLV